MTIKQEFLKTFLASDLILRPKILILASLLPGSGVKAIKKSILVAVLLAFGVKWA